MDMKSQVPTFVTFLLINFTFHKIPQILFYRNKMPEKTCQFILTRIFEISFEGGALWLVWLFWQVRPKCPFQFDKTVVPSTALLYPADNYCVQWTNVQWLGLGLYNRNVGLAHGISEVSNEIFAGWKAPFVYNHVPFQTSPLVKRISLISSQITVFLSLPRSRFCLVTQWALCCVTWIKRLWGRLSFPNKLLNLSTKASLGIEESGHCRGSRCSEVLNKSQCMDFLFAVRERWPWGEAWL